MVLWLCSKQYQCDVVFVVAIWKYHRLASSLLTTFSNALGSEVHDSGSNFYICYSANQEALSFLILLRL
jgi:ABC-type thiamin/hydroxymethylpyrimidine transport system permease subunit